MKKILVTGSKGFVAGYLIQTLLENNWQVVGVDNMSKYGEVEKKYDGHPNYKFVKGDVKDVNLVKELIVDCEQAVFLAAMVGGISYVHKYAYDLFAENERITASSIDAAIWAHDNSKLKKATVISSSMVYENTSVFPTAEGEELKCFPPKSVYGFQKLSCEYFAKSAYEQYQLPYTILRPFNCIGIGEKKIVDDKYIVKSGNINLALNHVIPDLVKKVLLGQNPLHILGKGNQIRHYTYGGDLAQGIMLSLENKNAINNDFNLSTSVSTTVLELSKLIWKKINGEIPFTFVCDEPLTFDVQINQPDTNKAKELLGFEAKTSLSDVLDEVIPWVKEQLDAGLI